MLHQRPNDQHFLRAFNYIAISPQLHTHNKSNETSPYTMPSVLQPVNLLQLMSELLSCFWSDY